MYNSATIAGRLGKDPDTRVTTGGMSVCKLSVATNHREKVDGEWTEGTEWHTVVVFGKTAEACERYLTKGRQVLVEGRIQYRKWDSPDGVKWFTEILANEVKFLGGQQQEHTEQRSRPRHKPAPVGEPDADIPF